MLGKDIKVLLKKDSFGNIENEPKLKGKTDFNYKNDKTFISKGIFTSCSKSDNCPPWSITSKKLYMIKKKTNRL